MTKNETVYDFVNNLLLEYATLVVGVAEIPSRDGEIHRAKVAAIMELRDATRTLMVDMIEKKMIKATTESVN